MSEEKLSTALDLVRSAIKFKMGELEARLRFVFVEYADNQESIKLLPKITSELESLELELDRVLELMDHQRLGSDSLDREVYDLTFKKYENIGGEQCQTFSEAIKQ